MTDLWQWIFNGFEIRFTPDNTLSVLVAVAGYIGVVTAAYLGYRAVEKRLRKEHTVDILLRLLITPDFADGLHILDNHIARDLYVVEEKLEEDDGVKDTRSLDMLMSFYEFMASAYRRGYLDKAVIQNQHIKHFHDSFIVLEELIKARRRRWDRPNYMREFEALAGEFGPKIKSLLNIPDPLTREKMSRRKHNANRVATVPA